MHYHKKITPCYCRLFLIAAVLSFVIEALFPHAILAQTDPSVYTSTKETAEINTPLLLPVVGKRLARRSVNILVTAYSSTVDQTDSTPFITASGTAVRHGVIAANFLPFGTKVRLPDYFGDEIFVVEDRMNERFFNRADIWMADREAAIHWGVRYTKLEVL